MFLAPPLKTPSLFCKRLPQTRVFRRRWSCSGRK